MQSLTNSIKAAWQTFRHLPGWLQAVSWVAAFFIAMTLAGSAADPAKKKTVGRATPPSTQTVTVERRTVVKPAPAPVAPDPVKLYKACIRKAGAKVKPEPPSLKGRIPVGDAGPVPATYVGAIVWPNGAYSDVWFADTTAGAVKTAEKLNEAGAEDQGVPEVDWAWSDGRVVGAPADTAAFADVSNGKAIDACDRFANR